MKTPLKFQISEFDCGTVSLMNAIAFLYEREEIPAIILKKIHKYTLDSYDESGNEGQGGTSKKSVDKLCKWTSEYCKHSDFEFHCTHLQGGDITLDKLKKTLNNNGCILMRTHLTDEHYVIITKMNNKSVYIFDPYFLPKEYYKNEKSIKIVYNKPFTHNRKITLNRLLLEENKDLALGEIKSRECVLISKNELKY